MTKSMTRAERDRERISRDTQAFLAAGGAIQQLPANMSADAETRFTTGQRGVPRYVTPRKVQPGSF